jgi:transcriptional regulator with XRE-family HTH domain
MLQMTKLREVRGWTKTELGFRARLHPARVGVIENGKGTPNRNSVELVRLALALGYIGDPGELLDPVDESAPAEAASA